LLVAQLITTRPPHPQKPAEKNVGALAEILALLPGARLAVVGDGPARAGLERRLEGAPAVFTVRVGARAARAGMQQVGTPRRNALSPGPPQGLPASAPTSTRARQDAS
jgi:hypothetical protein